MQTSTLPGKALGWMATAAALVLLLALSGCSSESDPGGTGTGTGTANTGTGGTGGVTFTGTGASGGAGTGGGDCSGILHATIRDFQISHPDFQTFSGDDPYLGIVEEDLGADDKPVYAHPGPTPQTTGPDEFAQWYNDTPDVNIAVEITIQLTETSPGEYVYDNPEFFPVDGQGWGEEGNPHNYHFTTELHTLFSYEGGEVFTFTGDDDLWLFVNGKLAIDLGGLHPPRSGTVDLDASASQLGISPGNTYAMDIFHAERRTTLSNFRIQTNIACFTPVPPPR